MQKSLSHSTDLVVCLSACTQDDSAEGVTKVVAKSLLTVGIPAFTEDLRAGSASTVRCGCGLCVV